MILDDIVRHKRADLERVKRRVSLVDLQQRELFRRARCGFHAALAAQRCAIIAEIKKASPSKGVIRVDFDPVSLARRYAESGAAAISVLTEERYFQGHLQHLQAVRQAVQIPLLRKDFLFDSYQLYEARAYGADAVLLIVAMLSDALLRELLALAATLDLAALVEVHDRDQLQRALQAGARIVGINNRDLRTFETTLVTTEILAPLVPGDVVVVAESGIEFPADIERLTRSGVTTFLIGEAFMRAADPGACLAHLLAASGVNR